MGYLEKTCKRLQKIKSGNILKNNKTWFTLWIKFFFTGNSKLNLYDLYGKKKKKKMLITIQIFLSII